MKLYYEDNYLGTVRPGNSGVDFQDMPVGEAMALICKFDKTWFGDSWHSVDDRNSREYLCGLFTECNCGGLYRAEWEPEDCAWNKSYAKNEKPNFTDEKGVTVMSDDIITRENASKEFIKAALEAAFMEVKTDDDGDIMVKERCNCFVLPDAEHGRILLMTIFNLPETASEEEAFRCANTINSNYIMIRAYVYKGTMRFTYDVMLDGGISKKAFIQQLRHFCVIPHDAVAEYGKDIMG